VIWQNPWAWLGIATVAIPVLIHLLGRDRAPRHSFPSLRFVEIAELPPTRRTRLHDWLLLATRVAILLVAAAALAQPLLLLANRQASVDDRLARAIIVDTSASMSRVTPSGGRAVDSARSTAAKLAGDARTSITVQTSSPRSVIEGAVAWLETQRSRRELVVVSDFQIGALDSAAVAAIPATIGIHAVAVPVPTGDPMLTRETFGRNPIVARVDVADTATKVSWMLGVRAGAGAEPRIEIDAADTATVDAVMSAARVTGVVGPLDTATRVTIVFGSSRNRAELAKRSVRVRSPRLVDVVARVRADSLLASTRSAAALAARDSSLSRLGPVLAIDAAGRPAIVAGEDTAAGADRLLVFSNDAVASVRSAALIATLGRALSIAEPIDELDPSTISPTALSSWQRAPASTPTRETTDLANGPSDARWLWVVALALLGVEWWLRRERRVVVVSTEERAHDRAA
jgi:hypothetical protein